MHGYTILLEYKEQLLRGALVTLELALSGLVVHETRLYLDKMRRSSRPMK